MRRGEGVLTPRRIRQARELPESRPWSRGWAACSTAGRGSGAALSLGAASEEENSCWADCCHESNDRTRSGRDVDGAFHPSRTSPSCPGRRGLGSGLLQRDVSSRRRRAGGPSGSALGSQVQIAGGSLAGKDQPPISSALGPSAGGAGRGRRASSEPGRSTALIGRFRGSGRAIRRCR